MTSSEPVTEAEQRLAVEKIAPLLAEKGYETLLLGSVAVLYKTDRGQLTKDVDIHVSPTGDIIRFYDDVEMISKSLEGRFQLMADGASITLYIPIGRADVPIEIIEGREDFIEPDVLSDALSSATQQGHVKIPTWAHLICMKAEAWFDRTGPEKSKFLEDLLEIKARLTRTSSLLDQHELERIIKLRPGRKHLEMRAILFREFAELLD